MKALTGSHLSLTTLPDAAVQNIVIPAFGRQPQDANYIYVLSGAQPQAPGRPMTNPSPQSSKHVGSSADGVSVSAGARYGIPCVY